MPYKKSIYYILICSIGFLYSQDIPEEFEFNESTQSAFYFFNNIEILGVELDDDDWMSAFTIYDETLGGICTQEYINYDETNNGLCQGIGECYFGATGCVNGLGENASCPISLDIDGKQIGSLYPIS